MKTLLKSKSSSVLSLESLLTGQNNKITEEDNCTKNYFGHS